MVSPHLFPDTFYCRLHGNTKETNSKHDNKTTVFTNKPITISTLLGYCINLWSWNWIKLNRKMNIKMKNAFCLRAFSHLHIHFLFFLYNYSIFIFHYVIKHFHYILYIYIYVHISGYKMSCVCYSLEIIKVIAIKVFYI